MKRKRNIERLRRTQGCLTDCVAYFLNVHPQSVPYFMYPIKGWSDRLKKYMMSRGFICYWKLATKAPAKGIHLVCGDSLRWKTASHCVVYKNGKLKYDPNYPSRWNDKRITHRLVIIKK